MKRVTKEPEQKPPKNKDTEKDNDPAQCPAQDNPNQPEEDPWTKKDRKPVKSSPKGIKPKI